MSDNVHNKCHIGRKHEFRPFVYVRSTRWRTREIRISTFYYFAQFYEKLAQYSTSIRSLVLASLTATEEVINGLKNLHPFDIVFWRNSSLPEFMSFFFYDQHRLLVKIEYCRFALSYDLHRLFVKTLKLWSHFFVFLIISKKRWHFLWENSSCAHVLSNMTRF